MNNGPAKRDKPNPFAKPKHIETSSEDFLLSTSERYQYVHHEVLIRRGIHSFLEVGQSLMAIREGRLYREDYTTFAEYCEKRWGISRQRGYQMIDASQTQTIVSKIFDKKLELNESQAKAIGEFDEDLWPAIIRTTQARFGKLTASAITQIGGTIQEMALTGHVDTGNGHSVPVDAAMDVQEIETIKRQKQHIADNSQWDRLDTFEIAAGHIANKLIDLGLDVSEIVKVTVYIKKASIDQD